MTGGEPALVLRRLLVAVDASEQSVAALDAAASLARRLGVDLHAIFVEDEDLLRLADLPMARVIDAWSAAARTPDASEIERSLRAAALRARRDVERSAARERVRCSFRVARGRVAPALVEAAADADLVCLGAASGRSERDPRVGSTARAVVARAASAVLVVRTGGSLSAPTVVLHDGTDAARRAVAAAGALARHDGGRVVVLIPPGPEDRRASAERDAAAELDGGVVAEFRDVAGADAPRLVAAVRSAAGGALVLPRTAVSAESLAALVARAGCSVLVAR